MTNRILENKTALIHGAGGAIGGAVARAFARQGAKVFLAGRTLAKLDAVAKDVSAAGGTAETAHADAVAARAGRIDIALNAVGIKHVQGTPFAELSLEEYALPITGYTRTNFITAKAAARHMIKAGRGVILTLSTPGSRMAGTGFLGYGVTCAAVEAFTRLLAAELGASGIRVNCVRPHANPARPELRGKQPGARGERDPRQLRPASRDPRSRGKGLPQPGRLPRSRRARRCLGRSHAGPDGGSGNPAEAPAHAGRGGQHGGLPRLRPGQRDDRSHRQPHVRRTRRLTDPYRLAPGASLTRLSASCRGSAQSRNPRSSSCSGRRLPGLPAIGVDLALLSRVEERHDNLAGGALSAAQCAQLVQGCRRPVLLILEQGA